MRDLVLQRLPDLSREGRADARLAWKQTGWVAALNALDREAGVVLIAGRMILDGKTLTTA